MNDLSIKPTGKTLAVNCKKGRIEFLGCSITNDPKAFFSPVMEWVKKYNQEPEEITEVICKIEYIDSASFKNLFNLLKELTAIKKKQKKIVVKWYFDYEDPEVLELGEILKGRIDLDFELIQNGSQIKAGN